MPELSPTIVLVVALLTAIVAIVALALAIQARGRLAALNRLSSGEDGANLAAAIVRLEGQLSELRADLLVVHDNTQLLRRMAREPLSHWGLVKFDAFRDMSGQTSFALAMVDESGDGVVLTSMVGRADTRVYAKPVMGGRVTSAMTDEESAAVQRAIGRDRAVPELVSPDVGVAG